MKNIKYINKILHNYEYDLKGVYKNENEADKEINSLERKGFIAFKEDKKGKIEVWVSTKKISATDRMLEKMM